MSRRFLEVSSVKQFRVESWRHSVNFKDSRGVKSGILFVYHHESLCVSP